MLEKPRESAGIRSLIGVAAKGEAGLAPGQAKMLKEEEALRRRKARKVIDEKD